MLRVINTNCNVKSNHYFIPRMTFVRRVTFVVIEFVITPFDSMKFVVIISFAFGEMALGYLAILGNPEFKFANLSALHKLCICMQIYCICNCVTSRGGA